ncbi:Protocadherin gamma-A5 [Schistosoma japonicum]|uniref:Protocadherin gamma-A5 n=1 Tax=Schistosoma japonicum TaxID=6182 RepID=A0A4Z2DRT1_SCHJA|nr:Protocadherin gamma-A5 [Schistosoma japonicum]
MINEPSSLSTLGHITKSSCEVLLQALQFIHNSHSRENDEQQHRVILIKIHIFDINDNAPSWQENTIQISIPEHTSIGTRIPLPIANDPDCGPINTTVNYSLLDESTKQQSVVINSEKNYLAGNAFHLDAELISNPDMNLNSVWNYQEINCIPRDFRLWLRITHDLDCDDVVDTDESDTLTPSKIYHSESVKVKQVKLTLVAMDGGQPVSLTGTVAINITVTDINDHAPEFVTSDGHLSKATSESTSIQLPTVHSENGELYIQIPENTPAGRVIYKAQAVDRDESDKKKLKYALGTSAGLDVRDTFRIDPKSGEVILLRAPDYEQHRLHILPITVTDGKHIITQKLTVRIQNINDHPPVILVRPVVKQKPANFSPSMPVRPGVPNFMNSRTVPLYVTEHEPPGQLIGTVTVTDADEIVESILPKADMLIESNIPTLNYQYQTSDLDTHLSINCQLNYNGLVLEPLFKGAKNQFKLLTYASFDREQQADQFATLTCYDYGQPSLSSQVGLHLIIEDINDHGPQFKQSKMIAHIKENIPSGTKIYKIDAHDPDIGSNALLGFRLDGQYVDDFMIDSKTGTVTSLRPFDREQIDHFNLSVIVYDQSEWIKTNSYSNENISSGTLTSVDLLNRKAPKQHIVHGNLYVYIDDVNDCVPTFDNSLYQLSVSEDAKINHLIGQIEANDSDATEINNQIHYVIKPQIEGQVIHEFRVSTKGYIYVARGNLDREKVPAYNFYLVAMDSGLPTLSSSTQVHIHLIDVNDNSPQWIFPAHNYQIVNLTINEPVGYRVAQLIAEDLDENENGEVTYRLVQTSFMSNMPNIVDKTLVTSPSTRLDNTINNNLQIVPKTDVRYMPSHNVGNLFELDSISGAIYVGRSMSIDDVGSIKLVLEASDRGHPAKVNHRVLQIDIFRYLSQTSAYLLSENDGNLVGDSEHSRQKNAVIGHGNYLENDLIVIVIMVAVTLIISLILILAILFLRCGGSCTQRNTTQYEQNNPRFYRQNLNHTHHLEEVFRDSGMLEVDGLLSPRAEHLLGESGLNTYSPPNHLHHPPQSTDSDKMIRSFLSNADRNQWMMATMDTKKPDTLRSHKLFNSTHPFHPSPTKLNDLSTLKRASQTGTICRLKPVEEQFLDTTSAKNSPDHELKLLMGTCPTLRQQNQTCSTFKAGSSQISDFRVNSPSYKDPGSLRNLTSPNEITEDIESMDSGHGCSTDTAMIENHFSNSRPQSSLNTFRVNNSTLRQAPACYCALNVEHLKSALSSRSPELLPTEPDDLTLKLLAYRRRSGTLPLSSIPTNNNSNEDEDGVLPMNFSNKLNSAKSSNDLLKTVDTKCCLKYNVEQQQLHQPKNRLSVSWLDTHVNCNNDQNYTPNTIASICVPITSSGYCTTLNNNTSGKSKLLTPSTENNNDNTAKEESQTDISQSNEGTMILFSPVDPLGYAQLIHTQSDDQFISSQNIYTKFPTSFV